METKLTVKRWEDIVKYVVRSRSGDKLFVIDVVGFY